MIDWEKMMNDLAEMYSYFTGCALNAAPNSKSRKQFTGYTETLYSVMEEIKEMMDTEDDGK